jgi:hypothetical protein
VPTYNRFTVELIRARFCGVKVSNNSGCMSMTLAAHNIVAADPWQVCILAGT